MSAILWLESDSGSVRSETTLVKSGDALSWKMATGTSVSFPTKPRRSGRIVAEITAAMVGNLQTLTLEFLHDNATGLTDNDIDVNAHYPGSATTTQFSLATTQPDPFASPTTHASSAASWTTTGMSNPNAQKMVKTFTPNAAGLLLIDIDLFKASYTVYVSPFPSGFALASSQQIPGSFPLISAGAGSSVAFPPVRWAG